MIIFIIIINIIRPRCTHSISNLFLQVEFYLLVSLLIRNDRGFQKTVETTELPLKVLL